MSKSFSIRALFFISRRFGITSLFQTSLCTLGFLYLSSDISLAQVTSDGTVNTQVTQNGNGIDSIDFKNRRYAKKVGIIPKETIVIKMSKFTIFPIISGIETNGIK
ncbi:MAG: hypothetical protein ACRC80_27840, partial [Waterburya sp.]